jgi:class 3 adenylate cyclase/tetratricopeptide (TPR) repeat protein
MEFDEILAQVIELLQRQGRISYGALKRRFHLDDEYLQDLKDELIDAQRVAVDEGGKVLAWKDSLSSSVQSLVSEEQSLKSKEQEQTSTVQTLDPRRRDSRPDAAERRQLTVMFCDLVGSTALSTQLDPEELREVVRVYQETCTEVIRRYDGHIAQHLGDGLLVYFGYPAAHEDDAQRAVRTGLEIVQALQSRARQQAASAPLPHGRGSDPLRVRIGIHTGLVVIGEIGSSEKREILALGETPNLAARIQGQANPDEVVISAATYHLVEGLFECEGRGEPELKGVATPLTLYRVLQESETHSRFQVVARKGLTPLVGREHEVGLLRERWERVKDGAGQVVLLSGEPGIGKSRLVEALKETVEREGVRCLELRCSPYAQNSALQPVVEHLQRVLRFRPDDTPDEKLRKLSCAPLQTEAIPLLATLLSLPHPTDFPALTSSPQKQKEKTLEALVAWLSAEAKQHPVVYAWEDLHWADPSTLELLTLFLAQVPTARLLAVLTFRPEFVPPWGVHSYLSQLTLSRMGRAHVEAMVEKVTGGKALPTDVIQQIVSKTDGVPLFVEELTKSVVESVEVRNHSPLRLGIPATLQDALMARLDRLGPAKEIAQLGATLGREFTYELLHAVSLLHEETLQQSLRQLVEAELVFQSGMPPQATYLFKHALVQDTAYQSLLKSRRQQLHQQVARVLVRQFPQVVETQPELVAHHYTEAGLIEQAIPYWQQAGERSVDRSAYVEAISHLSKGLELLKTLPETMEHLYQELNLQTPLGLAFMATKWYGAPEVGKAYTRARELCRQLGETPQLAQVLYGLWIFHLVQAELQTAYEAAEQLLRLGENTQDLALIIEGHHGLGQILYYMGKFAAARDHLEQAIVLYDPQPSSSPAIRPIQDPGVLSRGYAAWSLWFLGYPDQALQRVHEAFDLAQKLSHPMSFGFALNFASTLHQFRKEEQPAQEWAETITKLASEHGVPPHLFSYAGRKSTFMAFASEHDFTQFVARGTFMREAMLAGQGQVEEDLTQLHQSINTYLVAGGAELLRPIYLSGLAAAHGTVGQIDEGLTLVTEALAILNNAGQRLNEVGLYLLKGSLLLKIGGQKAEEVEKCFRQALDVARRQEAKSLELQAATRLARLWRQQGKRAEAHKLLSEVYNWFTEGFDTKDLQEAKTLLEELNR